MNIKKASEQFTKLTATEWMGPGEHAKIALTKGGDIILTIGGKTLVMDCPACEDLFELLKKNFNPPEVTR